MTTLYLTDPHAFVRKEGGTLVAQPLGRNRDGTRPTPTRLPLAQVTEVVCIGDVSWSGGALRELSGDGISVSYLDGMGRWVGRWEPAETKTVLLRRAQFRAADDPERATAIARSIVAGKLRNSRALLQRATRDGMLADAGEISALAVLADRAERATTIEEARGIEGEGAALYFAGFSRLVSVNGFTFTQRLRRPPPDEVNGLLSFGYTLLTTASIAAVRIVGFDAHVGYLHADRFGRESLALDLCEEFRAYVVDALVSALIHRRVITPDDFDHTPTGVLLKTEPRRRVIEQFERKLAADVVHPVLRYKVSHRRAIEIQARLLAKHLLGELPRYVPFAKR